MNKRAFLLLMFICVVLSNNVFAAERSKDIIFIGWGAYKGDEVQANFTLLATKERLKEIKSVLKGLFHLEHLGDFHIKTGSLEKVNQRAKFVRLVEQGVTTFYICPSDAYRTRKLREQEEIAINISSASEEDFS